ncbi:class I SAM-dependent methyltransferase [Nocardia grenadensis]|uniref:class I SAM-dependent methyltransferase n=1 Tax=Nocardia grenadensis TaxID=931537 RepID=UPI003D8D9BD6
MRVVLAPPGVARPVHSGILRRPFFDVDLDAVRAALRDPEVRRLPGSVHDEAGEFAPEDPAEVAKKSIGIRVRPGGPRRTVEPVSSGAVPATAVNGSSPWARVFATLYDPLLWLGEKSGMADRRRDLLGRAQGRTVELGSGTGLNLKYYPRDLDELTLTEPEAAMRIRLTRRLGRERERARVVDASAEQLPFADGTVDTVVSTLVLCTVTDPDAALQEIERVLHPRGRLLFIEHVRSESPRLARWQDRLAGPWRRFAEGCHCNRATLELIRARGLDLDDVQETSWRRMPPIVRPLIMGVASKAAPGRD